jgi:hypothetical protein
MCMKRYFFFRVGSVASVVIPRVFFLRFRVLYFCKMSEHGGEGNNVATLSSVPPEHFLYFCSKLSKIQGCAKNSS